MPYLTFEEYLEYYIRKEEMHY